MKQTKQQKIDERRIEESYRIHCSGIPISIMDIGKVFAAGQRAIDHDATDAQLGSALRTFAESISE